MKNVQQYTGKSESNIVSRSNVSCEIWRSSGINKYISKYENKQQNMEKIKEGIGIAIL